MLLHSFFYGSFQSECSARPSHGSNADYILSGAWIAASIYMIYIFGAEILQGLEIAAGRPRSAKKNF
jgi:hypothetical protein